MGADPYPGALSRIAPLATLEPGWNGHRAAPISKDGRRAAIAFLADVWMEFGTTVAEPTIVAPTPDGGVALEWIVQDGDEVGVEVVCFPAWDEYTVRNRRTGAIEDEAERAWRDRILRNVIKPHVVGHAVLPS